MRVQGKALQDQEQPRHRGCTPNLARAASDLKSPDFHLICEPCSLSPSCKQTHQDAVRARSSAPLEHVSLLSPVHVPSTFDSGLLAQVSSLAHNRHRGDRQMLLQPAISLLYLFGVAMRLYGHAPSAATTMIDLSAASPSCRPQ
jgi:hypothetical protein